MESGKIYMIILIILSLIFAVLMPLSLLITADAATAFVVLLQEILYISLIWLAWKNYKEKK